MANAIIHLDTRDIIPGANDRTNFDQVALEELASTIREHGLLQPITVRWNDDANSYQIIAGERRFRACKHILGWDEIPAIVADVTDEQASALMLIENVSRQDLDPIDEGNAYATRMSVYGWSADDCARHAGVSIIRVHFRIKLLRLRPEVQKLVRDGQLPLGYAQILSSADLASAYQMLAVQKLRSNSQATPAWFRSVVNEIKQAQDQLSAFDLNSLLTTGPAAPVLTAPVQPPRPSTDAPPTTGNGVKEILSNQVAFWHKAAQAWDRLGKPFKRQECAAAAAALTTVLAVI